MMTDDIGRDFGPVDSDLYGFQQGELVQLLNQPTLFGRVERRTSGEGRLFVACKVNGRTQHFAVRPADLKSLTKGGKGL